MKKLILLGSALFLSDQVSASVIKNGDELYKKAKAIRNHHDMTSGPVPLEYFEALDQAASAGSKKAKEELKDYYDKYVIAPAGSMRANVTWGNSPEDNTKIREIFTKWIPKG